jgi:hypothetical protein
MAPAAPGRYSMNTMSGSAAAAAGTLRTGRSYSSLIWKGMGFGALALAFLPIPVATLELLPAYRTQARFLAFYAPMICFLTLAYLFYVRDTLARLTFAGILDPLPPVDPYYKGTMQERLYRLLVQLRGGFIMALPALLLIASLSCTFRYTRRLNESVALAGEAAALPDTVVEGLGYIGGNGEGAGGDQAAAARARILATVGIDDIPLFAELTALYIGIFVTALAALIIMWLKEYAKEAIGLSEEDLLLGSPPIEDSR